MRNLISFYYIFLILFTVFSCQEKTVAPSQNENLSRIVQPNGNIDIPAFLQIAGVNLVSPKDFPGYESASENNGGGCIPNRDSLKCTTHHVFQKLTDHYNPALCDSNIFYCCDDTVYIRYTFKICQDLAGNFTLDYYDFSATPGCDTVILYWHSLEQQNLYDSLDREIDRFEHEASLYLENKITGDWIKLFGNKYSCPNTFVSSNFYSSTCFKRCVTFDPTKEPAFEEHKLFCGRGCCKRTRAFCLTDGIVNASEPSFEEVGGPCTGNVFLDCSIFSGGFLIGQCHRTCDIP